MKLVTTEKTASANRHADVSLTFVSVWFSMVSLAMADRISVSIGAFLFTGFAKVFRKPSKIRVTKGLAVCDGTPAALCSHTIA